MDLWILFVKAVLAEKQIDRLVETGDYAVAEKHARDFS